MNIKLNLNNIEKDCYGIAISENIKPLDIKNEVLFTAVFKEAHNADFLYNFLEFKRMYATGIK